MVDDTDVREPRSISQRQKEQTNQGNRTTERAFFNSPQIDSRVKPTRSAVVVGAGGGGGGGGVSTGTAADFEDLGDQNGLLTVEITLDADREYIRQMRMVNALPITVSIVSDGLPTNNIIEMFLIFVQDGAGGRTVNPLVGTVPGVPTADVPNPPSTASIIHDADIGPSLNMDGNRTTKYRLTTYNGGREWFVEQVTLTNVAASLQELSDVELDMLAGGQILKFNEFDQVWKNEAGVDVLNDLSNVIALGPTDKHILAFDGASQQWVNRTLMDVADPNLYSDAEDAVNAARDAAIDFFAAAESAVTTARDAALTIINAAEDAINAARDAAIDIINAAEDLVITTRDAVIDVLNAAEDLVETTRDAIISVIESARDAAIDVIEAAERLVETTRDAAIAVIEAAERLVETARDAAIAVIESLRDAANEVIDNARDAAVVVINTTRDAANDVIDNAEEAAVLTINTARDAAIDTIEAAESLVETTRDSAIATINATANAIDSIFDSAGDFTQDFLNAIRGDMPTMVDLSSRATQALDNLADVQLNRPLIFGPNNNQQNGPNVSRSIGADANSLYFKSTQSGAFFFQSGGGNQLEIFNRGLRLQNGFVGPTVNGEIKRVGNTVAVMVNGEVKDLSLIGTSGGGIPQQTDNRIPVFETPNGLSSEFDSDDRAMIGNERGCIGLAVAPNISDINAVPPPLAIWVRFLDGTFGFRMTARAAGPRSLVGTAFDSNEQMRINLSTSANISPDIGSFGTANGTVFIHRVGEFIRGSFGYFNAGVLHSVIIDPSSALQDFINVGETTLNLPELAALPVIITTNPQTAELDDAFGSFEGSIGIRQLGDSGAIYVKANGYWWFIALTIR